MFALNCLSSSTVCLPQMFAFPDCLPSLTNGLSVGFTINRFQSIDNHNCSLVTTMLSWCDFYRPRYVSAFLSRSLSLALSVYQPPSFVISPCRFASLSLFAFSTNSPVSASAAVLKIFHARKRTRYPKLGNGQGKHPKGRHCKGTVPSLFLLFLSVCPLSLFLLLSVCSLSLSLPPPPLFLPSTVCLSQLTLQGPVTVSVAHRAYPGADGLSGEVGHTAGRHVRLPSVPQVRLAAAAGGVVLVVVSRCCCFSRTCRPAGWLHVVVFRLENNCCSPPFSQLLICWQCWQCTKHALKL